MVVCLFVFFSSVYFHLSFCCLLSVCLSSVCLSSLVWIAFRLSGLMENFFKKRYNFFRKIFVDSIFFITFVIEKQTNLNRVMKQFENLFQFSHVVKIYVPGTINENETAVDLQKTETENALSFMCGLFGGATCGRFTGSWKNDAGEVITEPVNIVYSYFDGELSKVMQLVEYAESLCKRMNQDCISIEFDGKLGFITAE